MQKMRFRVKGVVPLLMHNGEAANPRGQYAGIIKALGKDKAKKATEEGLTELLYYQFLSGLYLDEKGKPCVPGHVIEATLIAAAKHTKDGGLAKLGMFCNGNWPLIYKGPTTAKKLAEDDTFQFNVMVRIPPRTGARVLASRPIFREWELEFVVSYNSQIIDDARLVAFVKEAGEAVGFCDWRPRFGRFELVGKPKRVS